jgi:hypothetical protein
MAVLSKTIDRARGAVRGGETAHKTVTDRSGNRCVCLLSARDNCDAEDS